MPRHYLRGNRISCFCFLCQSNHWRSLKSIPAAFQNGPGGAGGESEGEGTSCVQLLFVFERGDEAPHHCQGRSLPSPVPSSLSVSHTMGQLPKLALLDCLRLVPLPRQMCSVLMQEGQPRGGRDVILNRFVLSQQLLLVFCPHFSSHQLNSCTKGSPHLHLKKCHRMEQWARSS